MRHQSDINGLKNICESLRCSISSTEKKVLVLMSKTVSAIFYSILDGYEDESRLEQVQSRKIKMNL